MKHKIIFRRGYVEEDERGRPTSHKYAPLRKISISSQYIVRAVAYLALEYFSKCTTGTVIKIGAGLSLYNHLVDQIPFR